MVYAKFSKCEFWLREVQFSGDLVNQQGILDIPRDNKKGSLDIL